VRVFLVWVWIVVVAFQVDMRKDSGLKVLGCLCENPSAAARQVEYLTRLLFIYNLESASVRDTHCTHVTSGTQGFVLYDLICRL